MDVAEGLGHWIGAHSDGRVNRSNQMTIEASRGLWCDEHFSGLCRRPIAGLTAARQRGDSLGAGLVAAYLSHHLPGIGVEVFKGITPCVEAIEARPPNVIGFANYMWNTNICVAMAAHAREVRKDTLIVFGGPEIDAEPLTKTSLSRSIGNWLFLVRLRRNVTCTVGGPHASIEDENLLVGKLPLFN